MGLPLEAHMAMSQMEELPEVTWEPSPPKVALLQQQPKQRKQQQQQQQAQSSSGGAPASKPQRRGGSRSEGASAGAGSGSRRKSPTPTSSVAAAAPAGAAPAGGSTSHSKADDAPAASQQQQQQPRQDAMLQQILSSLSDPATFGPETPGGPRLRAFRQHSVVPVSTRGGRSCRKVRARRFSAAGAAAGDASASTPVHPPAAVAGAAAAAAAAAGGSNGGSHTSAQLQAAAAAAASAAAAAHTPGGGSTGKKQAGGLKRRVLLELLDKVQDLVKRRRADEAPLEPQEHEDALHALAQDALGAQQASSAADADPAHAAHAAQEEVPEEAGDDALLAAVLADTEAAGEAATAAAAAAAAAAATPRMPVAQLVPSQGVCASQAEDAAAPAAAVEAGARSSSSSSQEGRAAAAAKELEDFELLYGLSDMVEANEAEAAPPPPPQHQADAGAAGEQPPQPAPAAEESQLDEFALLESILADIELPAAKRPRTTQEQQQQQAGPAAAAVPAAATAGGAEGGAEKQQQPVVPAAGDVPLAGGRAEVFHEVLAVSREPSELLLHCRNPYSGNEVLAHLSHPWCDCPVAPGDRANIFGGVLSRDPDGRQHVYLSLSQGFFVLHPDVLLSGTVITTALTCVRRAWLGERFAAAGGGPGAAATRGTLLHELLQQLMVEVVGGEAGEQPLPGVQELEGMVEQLLARSGVRLHEVGLSEEGAAREMNRHLANISAWLRQYLPPPGPQQQQQQWQAAPAASYHQQQPGKQQQVGRQLVMQPPPPQQQQQQRQQQQAWQSRQQHHQQCAAQPGCPVEVPMNSAFGARPRVLLRGLADIEENIWAPRYGLKGQLDASLLVQLTRDHGGGRAGGGSSRGGPGGSWGRAAAPSGGQAWQQQGPLGSGWSGGMSGAGGGSWSGSGGGGGFPHAHQPQQQQQQQRGWGGQQQEQQHAGGASCMSASGGTRGVLAPRDLNQPSGGGYPPASGAPPPHAGQQHHCTTAIDAAGRSGGGTGAPVADQQPTQVFKGCLAGAAAVIDAFKASQAAATDVAQQQQQQQPGHVQSLEAAGRGGVGWSGGRAAGSMGAAGSGRQQQAWAVAAQQQQQQSEGEELLIVPFEFKTGKDYFSHKAQVSLYLLLMEVRYALGLPPAGLLWNVNAAMMTLVPARQEELSALLACRNRLAAHLWQEVPPPPAMLGDSHACSRCHSAPTCAAVHAVLDGGCAVSSGMEERQWQELAGSVSPAAAAWGSKWLRLLDWEEAAGRARRSEMWALTGAQRQARGGCIAGLLLTETRTTSVSGSVAALAAADRAAQEEGGEAQLAAAVTASQQQHATQSQSQPASSGQADRPAAAAGAAGPACPAAAPADSGASEQLFLYTFEQQQPSSGPGNSSGSGSSSIQGLSVAPGDMLVLSADGAHVNIARVDVVAVSGRSITVAASKSLQLDRYLGQAAAKAAAAAAQAGHGGGSSSSGRLLWRLDQDEPASTGMHQRAAVLRLAADASVAHVQRLRELIIDTAPPRAKPDAATQQQQQQAQQAHVGAAKQLAAASGESYLQRHAAELNCDQAAVLRQVVAMQDYCLVLGMPGTGKTSTIVHAVRALVASGASVLVAAYTNSALDNILAKLAGAGEHRFLRLGRASSCHPRLREYMPGGSRHLQRSTSELEQLAAATPIVGCPCLSAHHPLLASRPPFDVVIVDEAGQITQPAALPALLRGRSFVLVGDHHQLPPLVLDARASAGGLGTSLFRALCEAHPGAVVKLQRQYRMAGPIMALANQLVYGGELIAGSPDVEAARLALPRPEGLQQVPPWVSAALQPDVALAFLDTDSIRPAAAVQDCRAAGGGGTVNTGEAALVMQLLSGLLAAGVPGQDVGIMSPYKAQVHLLHSLVTQLADANSSSTSSSARDVEVLTIDRSQGRDKPVILLSLVRSNAGGHTGTLLSDVARLNVAVTRAKVKLLLLGSARSLRAGAPLMGRLLDAIEGGRMMQVPADALQQPGSS